MEEIEDIEEKKKALIVKFNNVMVRMVTVSDDVLRETLHDEYEMLEVQLIEMEKEIVMFRRIEIVSLITEMKKEMEEFYTSMFVDSDIIDALSATNRIDICKMLIDKRLRRPKTLNDRRELHIMCEMLGYRIILKDYECKIIDTIGRKEKTLILYCGCFEKIDLNTRCIVYKK